MAKSPNGDYESAIGDEVGHPDTIFTDLVENKASVHTSCSKCLQVGDTVGKKGNLWTITSITEKADKVGTLCSN